MIDIINLSKSFGEKKAVENLNLSIKKGSFFCFLGPNGAGKTTTIKMINGLIKPGKGSVKVAGFDILLNPIEAKRVLGYVPDQPFLYDKLTGREFLEFVGGLYSLSKDFFDRKFFETIKIFSLENYIDQLIEDYSHGMKQKLSFAACFLHEPEVIVVDEPWVGLDPKNIRFIKDMLKEKTRCENLTVFMSTHTLSIAEEIADEIGIINHGKLIHKGPVEEIKKLKAEIDNFEDIFLALTSDESSPQK